MRPYQPSLAAPFGGLILLILMAVIGGAAVGVLVSLIASLVYLIILFPIVMGLIGGGLVNFAVRVGKIRNPGLALGAAAVIGVVIFAAWWATDMIQFRSRQAVAIQAANPQYSSAEVNAAIDSNLAAETGQSGLAGYVLQQAQSGAAVWRLPVAESQLPRLSPGLSWVDWGIEFVLIVGLSVLSGRKQAAQPFCEACTRWYGEPVNMGTLGAKRSKELLSWIEDGQYVKLGEELQSNPALPNVGFFMADCGDDCKEGDSYVEVRAQKRGSRRSVRGEVLSSGLISASQAQEILTGIKNRKDLYGM